MTIEQHLSFIQTNFDPEAELVDSDAAVPDHWLGYLEDDQAARKQAVTDEFTVLANYLRQTSAGLMRVCVDGFLIHSPTRGLCRFLVRQIGEGTYLAYSRCPTAFCTVSSSPAYDLVKDNGDQLMRWMYAKRMDGLVDIWDFGGLLPSDRMSLLSETIDDWADRDWFGGFVSSNDAEMFIEIFSSGGGAYFIADLSRKVSDPKGPPAFQLSSDFADMNPNAPKPFWPTLDAWTAIALADA